ncbi:polycomb group RING finger protein 1 isoform X2 [Canis lupus familiaris]|uniref:polycomb group RING finger protein 1 isoform X2 n=1 Tax=Canis lupus familiaris TaxID=9615 RepID=UPI0003AE5F71|nr:polycomb group RING finger protein 1 isoform X2 [Canis lupus familiaris]XP_038417604.1 polycomb group RING finger protein 1 isoform X2 [Canis lupus familiaris]XP_038547573.1 polycomb group RING finger protein 1 isoform X2 [Canis lupus familiaris]
MASPQGGQIAIAMRLRNQLQSVYKMDPLRNEEEVRVKIKDLNEHIVCCLCAGYFVDATTITECLHTFCKSCIVKYLQTSKYCPMCNIKIHETQPLLNLKLDRVMQDIVYKLVPGLQDSEEKRIREFYQSRGLDRVTQPSGEEPALSNLGLPFSSFDHSKAHYYRYDEQLSLCLERLSSGKDKNKSILQNKYVRCSVRAEVRHLRRVLCHRLMLNPQHVQLLFDNEVLPDHMTMKQIWLSRWFGKKSSEFHHEGGPLYVRGPSVNCQRRGVEDPTHVKLRRLHLPQRTGTEAHYMNGGRCRDLPSYEPEQRLDGESVAHRTSGAVQEESSQDVHRSRSAARYSRLFRDSPSLPTLP